MSGDIVSVSKSEAESVIASFKRESENAKTAIRKVMQSRNNLTNFKGPRAERFKQETQDEMTKLTNAIQAVDDLAQKLKAAMEDIVSAGS